MAISQITADAFTNGGYVNDISNQYIGNCLYDWATSHLIWVGEYLVLHLGVWALGFSSSRCAGVGAVVSQETYTQEGAALNLGYDSGNNRTRQDYHGEFQPESTQFAV